MQIGIGILGLAPDAFWSMTMAEFSAALTGWCEAHGTDGPAAGVPPTRAELDDMMRRFPDTRYTGNKRALIDNC